MSRQLAARALSLVCAGVVWNACTEHVQAQTGPEPRLSFSVFGGVGSHGDLWDVPEQPLLLLFGPEQWDTLRLQRTITTFPMVGLNATYYPSSHLGFTAEIFYQGLKLDDTCEMLREYTDVQRRNSQLCNSITGSSRTVSNIGVTAGVAYRLLPRNAVKPYGRLQAGLALRSSSVIEMAGVYNEAQVDGSLEVRSRAVIADMSPTSVAPLVVAAIGLTFTLAPGYQLRAEIRDHVLMLERPTGPANDLGQADIERFIGHSPALVFGFDVVLEQKRGRRY